jgi:hypothetical protein
MSSLTPLIADQQIDEAINHAIDTHIGIRFYLTKNKGDNTTAIQFSKKFGQQVKIAFRNPRLNEEIINLRKELAIPANGFNLDDNIGFFKWVKDQETTDYLDILSVISKCQIIKSNPSHLLNELLNYEDLSRYKLGIILNNYISTDVYENHLTEEPFTGIFEFILFNKLMVPFTNGIAMITNYSDNAITLVLSANTTKRDFIDSWTEIANEQKKMVNYNKSKNRIKPKIDEDLKLLDIAAKKEMEIKKLGKKGKEAIIERTRGAYDAIDEVFGESEILSKNSDLKNLAKRRQKISRIKKLTGLN